MDTRPKEKGKSETDKKGRGEKRQQGSKPSILEWIVGGISALITLAMIGFLAYQAITTTTAIPRLSVTVEQIRPLENAFHVEFRVRNEGNATAAGVPIRGVLQDNGSTVEQQEVTIDYVPAHSERMGALFFDNDPRDFRLQIRSLGYKRP